MREQLPKPTYPIEVSNADLLTGITAAQLNADAESCLGGFSPEVRERSSEVLQGIIQASALVPDMARSIQQILEGAGPELSRPEPPQSVVTLMKATLEGLCGSGTGIFEMLCDGHHRFGDELPGFGRLALETRSHMDRLLTGAALFMGAATVGPAEKRGRILVQQYKRFQTMLLLNKYQNQEEVDEWGRLLLDISRNINVRQRQSRGLPETLDTVMSWNLVRGHYEHPPERRRRVTTKETTPIGATALQQPAQAESSEKDAEIRAANAATAGIVAEHAAFMENFQLSGKGRRAHGLVAFDRLLRTNEENEALGLPFSEDPPSTVYVEGIIAALSAWVLEQPSVDDARQQLQTAVIQERTMCARYNETRSALPAPAGAEFDNALQDNVQWVRRHWATIATILHQHGPEPKGTTRSAHVARLTELLRFYDRPSDDPWQWLQPPSQPNQ